mmetsp:Transcript_33960/g.68429  ORF Transcript_33960/g.68429 Transcript_33960/m.68429 type:complete len:100 (-) Transcript_33960:2513-2812(-)
MGRYSGRLRRGLYFFNLHAFQWEEHQLLLVKDLRRHRPQASRETKMQNQKATGGRRMREMRNERSGSREARSKEAQGKWRSRVESVEESSVDSTGVMMV